MNRRLLIIVLAALVAALTLSACGGGATPTPAAKTVTVDATDSPFAFTPNTFTAKVGEDLTFTITNKGALEHNFAVFDPSGAEIARIDSIAVGSSKTVKVKPTAAGAYQIVCDVPGHKGAGMVATLTVSE